MTARRQARARAGVPTGPRGVPRCLLVGRCIEVWDVPGVGVPHINAFTRLGVVRRWWLHQAGITKAEDQSRTVPRGSPWSVEYLSADGRAQDADERLARGGCTRADLPALAREAQTLYTRAVSEDDPRQSLRRETEKTA